MNWYRNGGTHVFATPPSPTEETLHQVQRELLSVKEARHKDEVARHKAERRLLQSADEMVHLYLSFFLESLQCNAYVSINKVMLFLQKEKYKKLVEKKNAQLLVQQVRVEKKNSRAGVC